MLFFLVGNFPLSSILPKYPCLLDLVHLRLDEHKEGRNSISYLVAASSDGSFE